MSSIYEMGKKLRNNTELQLQLMTFLTNMCIYVSQQLREASVTDAIVWNMQANDINAVAIPIEGQTSTLRLDCDLESYLDNTDSLISIPAYCVKYNLMLHRRQSYDYLFSNFEC